MTGPKRSAPAAAALPCIAAAAGLVLGSALGSATGAETLRVGDAVLEPVALSALPDFAADDLGAALDAFRRSCAATPSPPQPDTVLGSPADLAAACTAAAEQADARDIFERHFAAYRVTRPGRGADARTGFLTGYFEPELPASLESGPDFTAPVLARPDDLVSLAPGETGAGLDPALRAARATPSGLAPYPDRAGIEDGVLGERARPLLWLRDRVDLFVLQVQGSGRVRLPDGRGLRVLYDGKNGRPYTSIAKLIVQEGHLPLEGLTLARWTGWLRAHPEAARRLMRANASYVFFKLAEVADPALGPPGAAGAALTPGRSLAVDGGLWRYGLPFWLETRAGTGNGTLGRTLGRLVVAQDTGSAIVGPARGDLYLGTGEAAGVAAGTLREATGFVVLLPRPAGAGPAGGTPAGGTP